MPPDPVEIRLRTQISDEELQSKVGKILTEDDYNVLLTRDSLLREPNGRVLAVYRPRAIPPEIMEQAYPVVYDAGQGRTINRGDASGSKRVPLPSGIRSEAMAVQSTILGGFDPQGARTYCRLTSWTAQHPELWEALWPLLQEVGAQMKRDVPERYSAQMRECEQTHPDWLIPGTPFTTVTVNNTYETGVHLDKGDLDAGFSTLVTFRKGDYRGGVLVFPEFRVGVDMQHGDLLLMNAHHWHGNTIFDPPVERDANSGRPLVDPGFERISVVAYFRTKMVACKAADDEEQKRAIVNETRAATALGL